MTPEQRDVTRNALRKYGERHWARTPENRRWQSAIDEGIDYYQVHDPMRADLLRMRFFEQRPEDEILEQLHIGRTFEHHRCLRRSARRVLSKQP